MSRVEFDRERLRRVGEIVNDDIQGGRYDGMALCVAHHGRVSYRHVAGFADRETDRRLAENDVFSVMSLTKPMTAIAIFQAVERGAVALNSRVGDIIPEFGQNGKQRVTIAQLLSHTGGMPFTLPGLSVADEGDLEKTVAAACHLAPVNRPGEVVSYSAQVSYDVLGAVVERLDPKGRRYGEIVADDILQPLGMKDTAIGVREDFRTRRVPVVARADTEMNRRLAARDRRLDDKSQLPGGGAFSTLADMHRFAEMLRNGGRLEDAVVISPASLALATRNHTGMRPNNTLSAQVELRGWDPYPANLGLGFFLRGEGLFATPFGHLASPSTFGGIGAGSIVMWIDPHTQLTAVMLTSGLMDQVDSHLRFQRLSDMLHAALVTAAD